MKCKNCKSEIQNTWKYCPNCGTHVSLQSNSGHPNCADCSLYNTDQCDSVACFDEHEIDMGDYPEGMNEHDLKHVGEIDREYNPHCPNYTTKEDIEAHDEWVKHLQKDMI